MDKQEEKELTCPECGKGFQDMRGFTSHARHAHEISKNELKDIIQSSNYGKSNVSKIIGGIGLTLLAILTLGKLE